MACVAIPASDAFLTGVIGYLDCQAQSLGSAGYQALAASGSAVSLLQTILLTLFVALIGYRLMLGQVPSVREGVLAFVKIGIVLALATAWPAYQILVFDLVLREPAELAAAIGGASALPGSAGGLVDRLDGVDRALRDLAIFGVGTPPIEELAASRPAPPLAFGFDAFALGASRMAFLGTAIGGFGFLRIAAGILLALGPLFVAFLLFEGTRGLFGGWLRALAGIALGSVALSLVLGIELALLEPWLADLLIRRGAGLAIVGAPEQLFALTATFAGVSLAVMIVVGRLAAVWTLPRWTGGAVAEPRHDPAVTATRSTTSSASTSIETRSRAMIVADAVMAAQRREEGGSIVGSGSARVSPQASRERGPVAAGAVVPLGQSHRRTTRRVSAGAGRRDSIR